MWDGLLAVIPRQIAFSLLLPSLGRRAERRVSLSIDRCATYPTWPFSKDQREKKNAAVIEIRRAAHAARDNSQMMVTPSSSKWCSTINRRAIVVQAPSSRFPDD